MVDRLVGEYRLKLFPNEAEFEKVFLWMPVPYEDEGQRLRKIDFSFKPKRISQEDRYGNKMAFFEINKREIGKNLLIKEIFEIEIIEKKLKNKDFLEKKYKKNNLFDKYTSADLYVQSDLMIFNKLAKKIIKRERDLEKKARRIYEYVLSILSYGYPTFGLYTSLQAFDFRKVDCGGFATLFCCLCQCVGIPARVVSGFIAKNAKNSGYHAWSEFMLPDESWVGCDLAMAWLKKRDYFGELFEKRIVFCKGSDFNLVPELPDGERVGILQIFSLRLNREGKINDFQVDVELKIKKRFF